MPALRCALVSESILLKAPRTLNDPVGCRFSSFRYTLHLPISPRYLLTRTGVAGRYLPIFFRAKAKFMGKSIAKRPLSRIGGSTASSVFVWQDFRAPGLVGSGVWTARLLLSLRYVSERYRPVLF